MARTPVPLSLELPAPTLFRCVWDKEGSLVTDFSTRSLRLACRCAACVSEMTGKVLLDDSTVPETISVVDAELTGNYGVLLAFSDSHNTGIYSWESLLRLVPDEKLVAKIRQLAR